MVTQRLAASISLLSMTAAFPVITLSIPTANAEFCDYPAVGISANVVAGRGAFCNYPTEIKGSHLHCESGSFGFGGGGGGGLNFDGIGGHRCWLSKLHLAVPGQHADTGT